uniref:Uncharacterized protein n=1 Tax=Pyxicephalus adspersus TaxID=30357 RepID=A0AAV3AQU5_PYXAD|nr:TPA: hypothetical protein GDO54_009307 [Pyxicephalus adspersus]
MHSDTCFQVHIAMLLYKDIKVSDNKQLQHKLYLKCNETFSSSQTFLLCGISKDKKWYKGPVFSRVPTSPCCWVRGSQSILLCHTESLGCKKNLARKKVTVTDSR